MYIIRKTTILIKPSWFKFNKLYSCFVQVGGHFQISRHILKSSSSYRKFWLCCFSRQLSKWFYSISKGHICHRNLLTNVQNKRSLSHICIISHCSSPFSPTCLNFQYFLLFNLVTSLYLLFLPQVWVWIWTGKWKSSL